MTSLPSFESPHESHIQCWADSVRRVYHSLVPIIRRPGFSWTDLLPLSAAGTEEERASFDPTSSEAQRAFLAALGYQDSDLVPRSRLIDTFHRPAADYHAKFLKAYLDAVTASADDVVDELVELTMESALTTKDDSKEIPDMICRVDVTGVEEWDWVGAAVARQWNEVGATTWEAGWALVEWMFGLPSDSPYLADFHGKNLLELGGGIGWTAAAVARAPWRPASVVASDGPWSVVANARRTVEQWQSRGSVPGRPCACGTSCRDNTQEPSMAVSVQLMWSDEERMQEMVDEYGAPDTIIVADCAYDMAAIPALSALISTLVTPPNKSVAYVATTRRNEVTWGVLQDAWAKYGLTVETVWSTPSDNILPFPRPACWCRSRDWSLQFDRPTTAQGAVIELQRISCPAN